MRPTDVLAGADWITPIYSMIRNKAQDGICIRVQEEWLQVANPCTVLREHGVTTWAQQLYSGWFVFSLPRRQANLAQMILETEMGMTLEDTHKIGNGLAWLLLALLGAGLVWLTVAGLIVWR